MNSSPQSDGELLPPHTGAHAPMPDFEREVSRPNSRERGWNILATPGTYTLLAINIAMFGWMVVHGVSAKDPTTAQLIHYGATNAYLILIGQWWRLLTATFVHVGLLHIATNMWCLWNLGLLGEPLLGPMGLIAVYLITGIAGNLLSLFFNVIHRDGISVGAGASGAVFGIAGILIVLLSNKKLPIPAFELNRLRRSVIQFAVLNLIIGVGANFTSIVRIDNHAHIGGFLSGLALGVPLVPRMTSGRTRYLQRQKLTFAGAAFLLLLIGYFIVKLATSSVAGR
ncbi:MAG: rhomboid family intramembrane serine protease [Edaphobacter sp.]